MNMDYYPFLMSPQQHRARAATLRAQGTPKALEYAVHHENLAKLIEYRFGGKMPSPPIAPD